jgi:hypothetical protein
VTLAELRPYRRPSQPKPAHRVADDADVRGRPGQCGKAVGMGLRDHILPQRPGLDPGRPQDGVHAHAPHRRRVDQDTPIRRRPYAVPGRHNTDAEPHVPRKTHRGNDVLSTVGQDHHSRVLMGVEIPRPARLVVALFARP